MILTYEKAIEQALYDELTKNSDVVLFGEDIGYNLYGYTNNFIKKFGPERIYDIPLSEASVMGLVCGASMCGLRPIIDLTVQNFLCVAMDQIINVAAKTHYMYNGEYKMPVTIITSSLCGSGSAAQHSDRLHSTFSTIAGLKIIVPATPQDMYSMLVEAIEDDNPVLCFADRILFKQEQDISLQPTKTIGKCKIVREGDDFTIVTISSCLKMINEILPDIQALGKSPEIIDIRTVVPLDFNTIKKSIQKTGKVLICDTANKTSSTASEIASLISQYAFKYLKAPIKIIACEDIPIPFAKCLEEQIIINKDKILCNIRENF